MTAFVLWLYGLLVAASAIMFIAWGKAAIDLRREHPLPLMALRWCRPLVIASSLTLHAAAMVIACGYRAYDIVANLLPVTGSEASVLAAVLAALGVSKMGFVWAGAIEEAPDAVTRRYRVRWPWWAFLYVISLWAIVCFWWAGFEQL